MSREDIQTKTISFLRFPLIVLVVLIHSTFAETVFQDPALDSASFPFYHSISYICSQLLTKTAVPLFFMISGFLFFYKATLIDYNFFRSKFKRRIRTLLIPYLIWNFLILLLSYARQTLMPDMASSNIGLADYGFIDFIKSFWATGSGAQARPIAFQFWFIRDLIVINLLTPLIWLLLKRSGLLYLSLVGLLWFFNFWFDVPGISIMGIFFFSLGAYFSINDQLFTEKLSTTRKFSPLLYFLFCVVIFVYRDETWISYVDNFNILVGICALVSITSLFVAKNRWKESPFLTKSSFFIFAFHGLAISWTLKFALAFLHPQTDFTFLLIYFVSPVLVISSGLGIFYILDRWFPRITALLTGNRNK